MLGMYFGPGPLEMQIAMGRSCIHRITLVASFFTKIKIMTKMILCICCALYEYKVLSNSHVVCTVARHLEHRGSGFN